MPMRSLNIAQKGLLLVGLPLIFELFFAASIGWLLFEQSRETDRIERSKDILLDIHNLEYAIGNAMVSLGYDTSAGGVAIASEFEPFKQSLRTGEKVFHDLAEIRPQLREACGRGQELCRQLEQFVSTKVEPVYRDTSIAPKDRLRYLRKDIYTYLLEAKPLMTEITSAESRLQGKDPQEQQQSSAILFATIAFFVVSNLLLAAWLANNFSGDLIGRLNAITDNAKLLAIGRQLKPPSGGLDEIAGLDKVLYDASQFLEESRLKESAAIDNAADVICALDQRGRFLQVGAAARKVWQYEPDELIGAQIYSLIDGDSTTLRRLLEEASIAGLEQTLDVIIKRTDGRRIDTLLSLSWSQSEALFSCVAHDDSERRAVERMKERFLAMVSHDLRSPLMAVGSSFVLLIEGARGQLAEKPLAVLKKAELSIKRLIEMINELLEIEKLEAGAGRVQLACVSVQDVCQIAIDSVDAFAKASQIQVHAPAGDAAIHANEKNLVRILVNLLSNAIKFSPKNAIVQMDLQIIGDQVEIGVSDRGQGIAEEDRCLIFEKFKQSKAETRTAVKGTGLGLALVKALSEAQGGSVSVTSEVGKGSRFAVRLGVFEEGEDG